jgi:hypothetical protein
MLVGWLVGLSSLDVLRDSESYVIIFMNVSYYNRFHGMVFFSWTQRLEEKSFRLCRGSNLDRPVVQPVARHCTD